MIPKKLLFDRRALRVSPAVLFFPVEREFNFADSGILPTVNPVLKIQIWTLNPFFNLGSISPELSSTCDRSDFVDLSFLKVVIQFSKFSIQQIRIYGKTFLSCWKKLQTSLTRRCCARSSHRTTTFPLTQPSPMLRQDL